MDSSKIIVFRKNNISDFLGATIFKLCSGYLLAATEDITQPDSILLNDITGKEVFIVGGYYNGFIDILKEKCSKLEVYYNSYETPDEEDHIYYTGKRERGFASFAVKFNYELLENIKGSHDLLSDVAELIDEYIYGYPSEASLDFNAGVYGLSDTISSIEKVALVTTKRISIEDVIKRGKEVRGNNRSVVRQRVKLSQGATLCDGKYKVKVCLGDDNICDSCIALAKETGIGMIIHYNTEQRKTIVFCRVTKESGYTAREIMKDYINGDGTLSMGQGAAEGLLDIYKLFIDVD